MPPRARVAASRRRRASEVATTRSADAASRASASARSRARPRVVGNSPCASRQSYTMRQPNRSRSELAERPPEGALRQERGLADLEALAGSRQRGRGAREGRPAEAAVPGILAPDAPDRQQRHAGRHARRLGGLAGSGQRAVEDAPIQPSQRLRQLLRALAAVAPGDHRQDEDVATAGHGAAGIEGEEGQLRSPACEGRAAARARRAGAARAATAAGPRGGRSRRAARAIRTPSAVSCGRHERRERPLAGGSPRCAPRRARRRTDCRAPPCDGARRRRREASTPARR